MAWSRSTNFTDGVVVEPDGTFGSRRRWKIGGATLATDGMQNYAFFGAKGNVPIDAIANMIRLPDNIFHLPGMAGFSSQQLLFESAGNWGVDCQHGFGVAFDNYYLDAGEPGVAVDGVRSLAVDPTWPRDSWHSKHARSPSVIEFPSGVSGPDNPLADTKSVVVQLSLLQLLPLDQAKVDATLISLGDTWKIRVDAFGRLVFVVLLRDGQHWSVVIPTAPVGGITTGPILITAAFIRNGDSATISAYSGVMTTPDAMVREMNYEDWSDKHTGTPRDLMDPTGASVCLLNDWDGRHPFVHESGECICRVKGVRILTEVGLAAVPEGSLLYDSDDVQYDRNGTNEYGTPFRQDLRGWPFLRDNTENGTVALLWKLDEGAGVRTVDDSGETGLYRGTLHSAQWQEERLVVRAYLAYQATLDDEELYLERSENARMVAQWAAIGNAQLTIYNEDRSIPETVTIEELLGNIAQGMNGFAPDGTTPTYTVQLVGKITTAEGFEGGWPDNGDGAYVEVTDLPQGALLQTVTLGDDPVIGAMIRSVPIAPPARHLMAFVGEFSRKDRFGTTIDGQAICLAVAGQLPGPWLPLSFNWPLVVSESVDGAAVAAIDHPQLLRVNGDHYLLWSQEATAGDGDYEIYGMHLGQSWRDVLDKHAAVGSGYISDSSTVTRAMKKGAATTLWDGLALGSLSAVQVSQNVQAIYSGKGDNNVFELGIPTAGAPLAMRRATSSEHQDVTEAGGITDPSESFEDGQMVHLLVRSLDNADPSVATGKLVLLENPDGLTSFGDDKIGAGPFDIWDEDSVGEFGSANALRGGIRWRSPGGTRYTLIAAGSNIYWPQDLALIPGGWEIDWGLPRRKITDARIYIKTARSFVDFIGTPDAVICCIPGEAQPARWNEDEYLIYAGIPTPSGAPSVTPFAAGGHLESGNYRLRIAFGRLLYTGNAAYEYGSMSSAVDVTIPSGTLDGSIYMNLSLIWGLTKTAYTHYRVDWLIAYLDREVDGEFTGNYVQVQEWLLTPAMTNKTINGYWPDVEVLGSEDRGVPPAATHGAWWKGVTFYNNPAEDSVGQHSIKDGPGTVPVVNNYRYDSKLTAYVPLGERLLAFTEAHIWYGYGEPDETGGGIEWEVLSPEHGTPWKDSACKIGESWAAFWYDGKVWITNGNEIIDVGRPLGPFWKNVSASYWNRVVLTYFPLEDALLLSVPYQCNIPLRGAVLMHPLKQRRSWTPTSNWPYNFFFKNEFGEMIAGDSRYGRLYQVWTGEDDAGEEIEASGMTSVSYGRGPKTVDSYRYFSGDITARGGEVRVGVHVDRGKFNWLKDMRALPDPGSLARVASGIQTATFAAGGLALGNLRFVGQVYGDLELESLPGLMGRTVAVSFMMRGKNQGAAIRDLTVIPSDAAGRGGGELMTGRVSGGSSDVRWHRFDSVNLQDDPMELPSNVLCAGDNLDFSEHGCVKVRPGRRDLAPRQLNSDDDGFPTVDT